jgi:hypothetical protein
MDEFATYERIKNLALNPLSSIFFSPPSNKFHKISILFFLGGISREKKRIKLNWEHPPNWGGYLIKLAKNLVEFL